MITSLCLSVAGVVTSALCLYPHGFDAITISGLTVLLVHMYSVVLSVQYILGRGFKNYEDDDDE